MASEPWLPPPLPPSDSPPRTPTEWPGAWPVESADLFKTLSPGTQVRVWGLPSSVLADDGLVLNGRRGRIVGTPTRLGRVEVALPHFRRGESVITSWVAMELAEARSAHKVAERKFGLRYISLMIRGVYLRVGPATAIDALWRPRAALYRKPYTL